MPVSENKPLTIQSLIATATRTRANNTYPPVERWQPHYCGEMDLVIRKDGSWWHEGTQIARQRLIKLFARILRKDEDGETYLVTPAEKIKIKVDYAPFIAIRLVCEGEGTHQRIAFETNMNDVVVAGPDHGVRVHVCDDQEPEPYIHIRGNLEALMTRSTFYELVDLAVEGVCQEGRPTLGVWSEGLFFPLGPRP